MKFKKNILGFKIKFSVNRIPVNEQIGDTCSDFVPNEYYDRPLPSNLCFTESDLHNHNMRLLKESGNVFTRHKEIPWNEDVDPELYKAILTHP